MVGANSRQAPVSAALPIEERIRQLRADVARPQGADRRAAACGLSPTYETVACGVSPTQAVQAAVRFRRGAAFQRMRPP